MVLIILDGWGLAPVGPGNAITQASTGNMNRFWAAYPRSELEASGEAVGLPHGEVGNTETGHLNLGAGQIVYQDLPRINMAIADGTFFENQAFLAAVRHVRQNHSALQLMGLLGAGGVHATNEHLFALIQFARQQGLSQVFLHLFLDGRDSPPTAASDYLAHLEKTIKEIGVGKIASIMGRYFAMDRDFRWERTERAYRALTEGQGSYFGAPAEAITASYKQGKTDEFIEPVLIGTKGMPTALIQNNDAVIFYNFRIDRPRQLTKAFVLPNFEEAAIVQAGFDPYSVKYYKKHMVEIPKRKPFLRQKKLSNLMFITMTEYEKGLPVTVAFPPQVVKFPLARVLAEKGLRQLHLAETEKERFVTYYFNGLREDPFPGEDRVILPSPDVSTYDAKPEMAAYELTEVLLERLKTGIYDFIVVNFANVDMVGHTGILGAAIRACGVVDECLGKIIPAVSALGGASLICADHGNAEEMINPQTGLVDTEHSNFPVPFIIVFQENFNSPRQLTRGILADVAPTILGLLGIDKPADMSGRDLLG